MGGTCGMYGTQEKCIQGAGGETLGKESLSKPSYKSKDNIRRIFKKWDGGLDWIGPSQDMDMCRIL